jgi:23S rRNA pseudouridine955/2504/2580 synthase
LVLVVHPALRGVPLGRFLESELAGARRTVLRQWIGAGRVRVNGEVAPNDRRLRAGDVVQCPGEVSAAARSVPSGTGPVAVLFESATALVVAKPSGVPTVPDRNGKDPGVHGLLCELRPEGDLRIAHRLDRETSGCLLLAKGLAAARHFDAEFRAGRVRKTYQALVHGVVRRAEFSIDSYLGPDRRRPGKVVAAAAPRKGFREAHTGVGLRRAFGRHSLVELRPTTGRGHQLRVHLASAGHPIVGDVHYGGQPLLLSQFKRGYKPRVGKVERPLVDRVFLHAEALAFTDVDGADVAVTAPMPEDLAIAIDKLDRFSTPR